MNHHEHEPSKHTNGIEALAEAFEDLPGFSDSALLDEVLDNAVGKFGFSGDQQSAIDLLSRAPGFEVTCQRTQQSQEPRWFVRKKRSP